MGDKSAIDASLKSNQSLASKTRYEDASLS